MTVLRQQGPAALALLWLLMMVWWGQQPRQGQFVAFQAAGVMTVAPEAVSALSLTRGAESRQLERARPGVLRGLWVQAMDLWQKPTTAGATSAHQHGAAVEPPRFKTVASADWLRNGQRVSADLAKQINLATRFMHTAKPVRVLSAEELLGVAQDQYGFGQDALCATLSLAGGGTLKACFGSATPEGSLQYMRIEGRDEVYLMSGFVGEAWAALWSALD